FTPRYSLAAVTAPDGLIYAIGGNDGVDVNTVQTFDGTSWTSGVSTDLTAREGLSAVVGSDGAIYALGGLNSGGFVATAERLDFAAVPLTFTTDSLTTAGDRSIT